MNEELPRSKGDALLDRLMQLRMLYEKEHEVYDAAMEWAEATWMPLPDDPQDQQGFNDGMKAIEDAEDALLEACRRAKEGR